MNSTSAEHIPPTAFTSHILEMRLVPSDSSFGHSLHFTQCIKCCNLTVSGWNVPLISMNDNENERNSMLTSSLFRDRSCVENLRKNVCLSLLGSWLRHAWYVSTGDKMCEA